MPLQLKSEGELLNSSPSGDGGSKKKILTLKSEEELIPTNESKTNYVFGKGTTSLQDPLKYDFQTKTGIDNQELAAQSQGRMVKLGAGLVNTASSLVLDGLKDASYLLDFEQVGNLAKGTEQEFGNWFGDLMEQVKEASHMDVFRTKDSLGFHPESAGWWADAMPFIASGLSMIAPALGATKLISGAGKLTGMSKVMRGLGIAEEATAGITGAVVSRYMENTMEGKQTFDSTYQQAIAKGLSEEEAIAKAGEAARQNWTTNSAMLLQDIPQYMSFFKGFKGISAMLGESNKALGTAAKVGLTMGSEAAEEGFQFISDKEATRSALLDNKEVGKDNTFSDRMKDYMQDPEFWNSTFLGAIGGGIFEGVSQFKEGKRQRTYDSTLAMHKAVLTGDKPGYYRAQDNQFNDTTLEHLQKGTLDSFKDQLLFLKNNPERIEDPQERAEVMQRLDSKIQDLEYIEDLQKKLTLDKTKSNELKGLEIGASLSQRLAENRLRSVNLEINKANGEVIQTLSELPPDVIAYKQAKLTLDGMKQIEGLESKSKLLETNINNTAKDLVAAYPNLFESIEELNKTITTTADNTLVNLNKSKQIELKSIEESKDILFQINDPSKQKDLEEHITKLKEEAKKKEEERLKKEKAASGTPTDETEETTSTTSSTEQFAPGSQVQFRGQGQSVEVEDFDVEEGLVKIKGDDVLHPITDFYVPKTLPSTGPEILNNTDLTQSYTGESEDGTGVHAVGTKAAVQEILNTVSDITPITRVRLTKKVSVEGNIQRGLNHLLGKLPSSVKATLSPNKALDVVYELQTPDGTWIDAFHGRHSDQYVTVDEKGNTSTFRFTDNNRTQAKTLFKIREGDADNKKVRDLTDEEINNLINNQHKLDALNKVYQSIYNTQGETTLSAKELNEKYGITVFAKKGKFDTIKDDAVKPILSEISKANIDGEFYIFDKLNGDTWEELQLLGNPNNKDKSKELLSKVKNPNNFIGATNSRYLALGREANGELFLFPADTQIFTDSEFKSLIADILERKTISEKEQKQINDRFSSLIHIISPKDEKLELKLDISKEGKPSKLQMVITRGENKDSKTYLDIPLSNKTSINSVVKHVTDQGLKYIHPESFRRSIPKTENTDKIPTKELAGMFLSNVSKNVFKYSKIIVDITDSTTPTSLDVSKTVSQVKPDKTTIIPKSIIPTSTIKDQIAALEDKIANSSSEEEANSYFIEIEALEKQLLEGRKLESDIDRLRGETPINKISQQSAQTFIDFPEAEANVRKLISPASVVNFDDINTLITNIENKGETWGFFAGKSIYLNKAAQKGTEFHEVFHYVFRRLISDEQIRRLHMLAKVKYGTPTIKELSQLKNKSTANRSLNKRQLEELWLEEKMADTFMNYKLGKNKLENMGLIGKILSKIQDFLTWLVGHKTELQALFENINKGSFRSDITQSNRFTNSLLNPVFKQIPNGETLTNTGKKYTYTGLEEGRQIIRTIAAKVISAKMGTSKARMDVDILLDAAIAKAYQFNSLENNKDIIASKSPIEGLKIKRWLRSQQFVYSNPTSVALIKEQVKKQLDVFNFDKVDLDEEITATENERKLIDFDKNAINIGGFDSLNKEIRAYIGTTLYDTTDALGRPVKTAVDPQVVYQSIMKTLASTDVGNMMNKFRIFTENNPQTKAVYDRLTSETGYDETIGVAKLNPQLLQQFLNAFTTEKIKYLQILPNLETQTYKVFDANNAGKAQVDQWEKNFSETKDLTKSKIALQDAGSDLATGNIDKLDSIKKALASIGVDVSDTYIRYSLLAISDPFNPLVANYKDVKPLTRDDLSALAGILAKDNSPYEKGTKGAITRLQNIAQANYVFDEQVVSPNFQDANGETRYSYIKPSLMLERTRELRQRLSTPEGRKAFIEQLNTSYSHSYAFNDNNYLLTHKNADEIFSNLQLEFTGDIRQDKKGQEGTTFKGIDDRSFKLMQYGLFSDQKKIGDITFAKFYPKVLEASASAYSIELPVEKLYSNGRPTDRAINLLYDQFLQEVERIAITEREINNPDVVKIKDYHIGKLRGLHLFYFKYLENTKLGETILSKAKNYVSKADFHDMEEAIKTEIEANILNEIKQENQLLEDLGITSQNLLPKNVSTKDDIGNFYINSLININAYNDLIEMNPAFSKDAVDNVKRAKRTIAAKVSFGKGQHIVGFYKEPKAKGLTKDIDVADAQAMIDMNHFKFILQREGKLSPEIFSILNKIDDGEELTWDEILILKDKQVMLNNIKTVTSGPVDYHKMSDLILTKKLTSVKNDKGEWVAKPGKELLHNFRVQLENLSRRATMAQNPDFQWHQQMSIEQIDQIVPARILPESASKLLTYKPAELGPDGRYDFNHTNTRLIENKYSGRQVDTPSGKTEIVYGTQLIQLIDSEQDDNTIVTFLGKEVTLKELRHIYQNLLSQARTNSVDQAKKFLGKLIDGNLTEKEETKFRKKLLDTLEQSGADDSLLQFFGLDPMYNLNLPNTLNKYEQLFLAHFTKGVLNQKTAGLKLTLISDYGFNVKDEKTGEYRPLKYNPSGLSEVAMPAFTRELHNLKPGDILNAKQVLEMFGQRIPTQDKHSMIAFKVVEFLPSEYGSVAIFPKELIELSGADFDIDSIFVERKDFYMKGDKFVPFGTATTLEGKFEEFIQDQKQNNKDFIKLIKLGVPEQEALIELQLPSTLEEFKKETKGGTIILSNATINNQLVDANIAFLTNKSMVKRGIPQTPATIQRLSDVRDAILALVGNTSKKFNLNSPLGQFKLWKSNATGKENVGPAANTNLIRAFLAKAKVHLKADTFRPVFNGEKPLFDFSTHEILDKFESKKQGKEVKVRIQDTLSTILSAMTDNAKDPIAGDLNLSLTSLGPVLQLVSLGVDLYDAMLLVNQPIVKEYTEAIERNKTVIKIIGDPNTAKIDKKAELLKAKEAIDNALIDLKPRVNNIKQIEAHLSKKYFENFTDGKFDVITRDLEWSLENDKFIPKIETNKDKIETKTAIDRVYHAANQYIALYNFIALQEQGRYWQHLSKLLALNKGLPASFKETEKIKDAIEAFKLNSEEELPKEAPFDIRKALKGTHVENNIRLFKDIMNMSKQYFITQSSVFTKTIDEIENSIKENIRDKAGVLNDIKLDFLSYLAIDQYKKTIKRPLNQNLLTGPDSIIDQYKKIPAELKNNKLVKFLTINNKTTVPTLIANTRIKLSGIQIEELVESFRELFNDERTNQFARNLFEYLIVKDGMQFKNNSFIKFISPFMFTQMSDSLDVLSEEAFNDKISEESANDFKDIWFRHVDNQNYIKRLEPSKGITFSKENNQVRVKSFIEDVTLPEYTYIDKVLHKAVTLDKNNATYEAVSPIGNELQSPYSFKNAEEVSKNAKLDVNQAKASIENGINLQERPKGITTKKGVDFVFEQNPKLASIGTTEQYSQYLDSIFPDSKVKDIVYHGSNTKFEEFLEDNLNYFGTQGIAKGYGKNIYPVLIEIKKPYYEDGGNLSNQSYEDLYDKLDNSGADGFISNGNNLFVPKEPEQIHILGSKQDIEGFKNWTNNNTKTVRKGAITSNIVSMDIAIPILENLKERFNLDYEIVNEPDADWSGQYVGDKVLINSAKMQMHTLFHEFAHPFIRIVRKTNKPLWNSLVREIHETKDGKKGLDIVKQSYPELDETTQIEETIVQFIGRYAAKNIDKTTGQRLIDLIKEVLKNIAEFLGITVNPSTLAKMSLKELGALMASEAKIDISTAQQYIEPGEISQEKLNISESAYKEEVEPKNEITQLADKVKLFLEKKLAIIKNKQIDNKKLKENQIKRVLEEIKDLEGAKTINVFVEDSYQKIKQAEEQFDNLIKNKENLSRHEMISRLSSFNDFANGYSVLDEISKADIEEYFSNPIKGLKEEGTFTVQDKLSYAIMARDKIKQRYLKQGIPLLADYLLEQKSTTLDVKVQKEIDQLNKRIKAIQIGNLSSDKKEEKIGEIQDRISDLSVTSIDKKTLIKQLQLASKDEGAIDYLFSPLISSDDSVLALFAKSIKNELEEARLKDIKFAEKAEKAYTEYSKTATNTNNVAKFNEGLYEELEIPVGKDGDGNTIFIKKMGFVQKYDVTKFEKAKDEFFKKLGEKPTNKQKLNEWNISVAKWFNENTSPKNQNEINTILAEKEAELKNGIITKEEHQEWLNKVINEFNGKITYKQELTQPSNKYLNPKWSKLYSQDGVPISEKGKYHKFLLDSYLESQSIVPENFRRGYILPSIQKESIERAQTTGIKDVIKTKLKESAFRQSYDTEYGLAGLTEKDAKFLPVFFTQSMDSDTVSLDLISSIMKYSAMANKYQALNNINGEIALTKAVVGERSTIETNSKGQQIMDAFAKKMGYEEYIRKNGESFSQKHLDAFIDMIVYGEMQKAEEILGLDAGKLVNTFTGFSAITTIAVDLLKGVANNLQGNIQNRIEAASKEYFDKRSLTKGTLYYTKSVPSFLSDFGKISPKTLPSKLIELYDALQGKFRDEYGREVSGTLAKKLFTTNTLFFNQNAAEHEIQGSALFAILDYTKVKEKTGNQISLLEAYEKYGIDGIYENTNFTETKRKELQNSLHALNKRTQGVYNDFDKGTAQRYALGRLAIMYRKHLIPGYKRRFKKLSGDQELGGITEGYYRTFWNTFAKDLLSLQLNILNNWSTYTDFEKTQIRKTITEASFVLALTVLVTILKGAGDDDKKLKKSYLYNFLLYEASRMRSETAAYISPKDAYRVVKSPSAMTGTLDRGIKLTDQLLFTWDPDKLNYKRKTGVWNKGDNKSWAYFLKLLGYSGYNITPEEAVKSFEGSLNK